MSVIKLYAHIRTPTVIRRRRRPGLRVINLVNEGRYDECINVCECVCVCNCECVCVCLVYTCVLIRVLQSSSNVYIYIHNTCAHTVGKEFIAAAAILYADPACRWSQLRTTVGRYKYNIVFIQDTTTVVVSSVT